MSYHHQFYIQSVGVTVDRILFLCVLFKPKLLISMISRSFMPTFLPFDNTPEENHEKKTVLCNTLWLFMSERTQVSEKHVLFLFFWPDIVLQAFLTKQRNGQNRNMPTSPNILFHPAVTKRCAEVWCEHLLRRRAESNLWQRLTGVNREAAAVGAVEDSEEEYNSGILTHVIWVCSIYRTRSELRCSALGCDPWIKRLNPAGVLTLGVFSLSIQPVRRMYLCRFWFRTGRFWAVILFALHGELPL